MLFDGAKVFLFDISPKKKKKNVVKNAKYLEMWSKNKENTFKMLFNL